MPAGSSTPPTTIERCRLTDPDIYLFRQGAHPRLQGKMGAHARNESGRAGVRLAVWAPNARPFQRPPVDTSDAEQSVLAYLRRGAGGDYVLVACNFTPVPS